MTRQLENRVTALADRVEELTDELDELRLYLTTPLADELDDDDPDAPPITTEELGGGWYLVTNTATGESLKAQGTDAVAAATEELLA